jgi:hypothetical protein
VALRGSQWLSCVRSGPVAGLHAPLRRNERLCSTQHDVSFLALETSIQQIHGLPLPGPAKPGDSLRLPAARCGSLQSPAPSPSPRAGQTTKMPRPNKPAVSSVIGRPFEIRCRPRTQSRNQSRPGKAFPAQKQTIVRRNAQSSRLSRHHPAAVERSLGRAKRNAMSCRAPLTALQYSVECPLRTIQS